MTNYRKLKDAIATATAEIGYLEGKMARMPRKGIAQRLVALKAGKALMEKEAKGALKELKATAAAQGATHIHHGAAAIY